MKNITNEMYINQIKKLLEQYIYWQIDAVNGFMNGDFNSILPETFMVDKKHQMAICFERLNGTDINWEQLYMEASNLGRKKWFEENTDSKLKVTKNEHKNTNA